MVNSLRIKRLIWDLGSHDLPTQFNAGRNLMLIGEPAIGPLIKALDSCNQRKMDAIIKTLGAIGGIRVLEPLMVLLGHSKGVIRFQAILSFEQAIQNLELKHIIKIIQKYGSQESGKGEGTQQKTRELALKAAGIVEKYLKRKKNQLSESILSEGKPKPPQGTKSKMLRIQTYKRIAR